ncbi:MAG: DUF2273 domain-containing protein [Clostridia bacterium]
MQRFAEFYKEHKWAIILAVIGLLFAILFMTIGFWKTLLLIVLVGICFLVGYLMDKNGIDGVKAFFNKLFSKDTKNE